MITQQYQFEYKSLVLGIDTPYDVRQIVGLIGQPDVRNTDADRLDRHGSFPTRSEVTQHREILIDLRIFGNPETGELNTNLRNFKRAFQPTSIPEPLKFWWPVGYGNAIRRIVGYPRQCRVRVQDGESGGYIPATLRLVCSDPRVYADFLQITTFVIQNPNVSGIVFPMVFDEDFGTGAPAPSTGEITNNGDEHTHPVIRINGPIINPIVESLTQRRKLDFTGTLASDEFLLIDTDSKTILKDGLQSARGWLNDGVSTWFTIGPGLNILRLLGDTVTTATATVSARSAWL